MAVTVKSAKITRPNGSHWLAQEHGRLSKEELYPVLEIDLPRVGVVSVQFSADRYVSKCWNEATGESTPVMGDWRIYAREFTPSHGIGDAARAAVNAVGVPLIREWLASDEYTEARKDAALNMVKRAIMDGRCLASYSLKQSREIIATFGDALRPGDCRTLCYALEHMEKASALLGE